MMEPTTLADGSVYPTEGGELLVNMSQAALLELGVAVGTALKEATADGVDVRDMARMPTGDLGLVSLVDVWLSGYAQGVIHGLNAEAL